MSPKPGKGFARPFRAVAAVCLSVSLGACVTPGSYWHKQGSSTSEAKADLGTCRYLLDNPPSNQAASSTYTYQPMPGGVGGAVAAGLIGGLVVGIAQAGAAANAFKNCMRDRGYEHYAMTNDEQAKLSAMVLDSDKERYLDQLMSAGGDNVKLGVTKEQTDAKNSSSYCPTNHQHCPPPDQGPQLGVYDLWKTKDCPANRQPC